MRAIGSMPAEGKVTPSLLRFIDVQQHPFTAYPLAVLACLVIFVGGLTVLP
jgi:hypothetical protein